MGKMVNFMLYIFCPIRYNQGREGREGRREKGKKEGKQKERWKSLAVIRAEAVPVDCLSWSASLQIVLLDWVCILQSKQKDNLIPKKRVEGGEKFLLLLQS